MRVACRMAAESRIEGVGELEGLASWRDWRIGVVGKLEALTSWRRWRVGRVGELGELLAGDPFFDAFFVPFREQR